MTIKPYLTLLASFFIMLSIGSIYGWSIIAKELIKNYNFNTTQSQIIFGFLIGIFPLTMVIVPKFASRIKFKYIGIIAGILFMLGYKLVGISNGNFYLIFLGISILGGLATGLGYWISLSAPVVFFPDKKGLVTGIITAGFALAAFLMSVIVEKLLLKGYNVIQTMQIMGVLYGLVIIISSNFIYQNELSHKDKEPVVIASFIKTSIFKKLVAGIFLGTFAGLLVLGNLSLIGSQYNISKHILVVSVGSFAIANFIGRIFWGYLGDLISAIKGIFISLIIQSLSIISLLFFVVSDFSYLLIVIVIGFSFGANFVLFAKETAEYFGVKNLGNIYPFVFLGYAFAGITGPVVGGFLNDLTNSFNFSIITASIISFLGSLIFIPFKKKYTTS